MKGTLKLPEHVVIIGSGPAGWSAAIYAARANLKPLLFEGTVQPEMIPLGQLAFTTEVENYAGFPAGNIRAFRGKRRGQGSALESCRPPLRAMSGRPTPLRCSGRRADGADETAGAELWHACRWRRHRRSRFRRTAVESDSRRAASRWKPHTVIVATGARANYLGLPSEEAYKNRGVSACAVCDGALPRFRDKPLVVDRRRRLGGRGSELSGQATPRTVYLVHRRDELRASKIMQQRALDHPKIEIVWNSVVDEVLGDDQDGVTGRATQNTDGRFDARTVEVERHVCRHRAHAQYRIFCRASWR